ncbi:MAG: T9SS type A sorting domain-containing protein [Sphingobacteriaceae bacterium]|nr:T9SS type A sorting domain-containing protein [Sphingobacteriaceae bacterium]MBK7816092.1 T9SS type A sorting domain-containing protein [Sphingobacteriaceae bacterium]
MKKIFTLILTLYTGICVTNAQTVLLNETFVAPTTLNGWYLQNNSNPNGTQSWSQGSGTIFPAFSGGPNDYVTTGFNTTLGVGNISCFLVTPTLNLTNGGVFQFATRTFSNPAQFPDHLEVRLGMTTSSTTIGSTTLDVGAFTTVLHDINPGLTATGYPSIWTVYSTTLSSITGTQVGRFAFRYVVPNGGSAGSNSEYIGLDDVKYTAPNCPTAPVVISPASTTVCAGGSVTFTGSGATTYTWTSGPQSTTYSVSPSVTTVYTLSGTNPGGCPGVATCTVVIGPPPVVSVTNMTVCALQNATITAGGASTYSWSNGGTTPSIIVPAPTGSTVTYTVTGFNGPTCSNTKTVSIYSNTFLTVPNSSITACPNQLALISANGASSYSWNTGQTTQSIAITPTASGIYVVTGTNGSCSESLQIWVTIDPDLYAPSHTVCAGISATLVATGAQTYSWSNGSTSSITVVSPTTNTIYSIIGTSGACSITKTVSVTIGNNLSVGALQKCIGLTTLLQGYGANSYTWQPINDFNPNVLVNPTGPTVYTLTGVSGTCTGTRTLQITWCARVQEFVDVNESVRVYPNPFGTEVTIKDAYGDVRMVNMLGQLVLATTVDGSTKLNTEALSPGVYFILITDPKTTDRKIIKVIKN